MHFYLSHFILFFGFDILCACVSREDLARAIPVKSATAQARNDVNDLVHGANPLQRRVALAQCDGAFAYGSKINSASERRAQFIVACVTATNRSVTVINARGNVERAQLLADITRHR